MTTDRIGQTARSLLNSFLLRPQLSQHIMSVRVSRHTPAPPRYLVSVWAFTSVSAHARGTPHDDSYPQNNPASTSRANPSPLGNSAVKPENDTESSMPSAPRYPHPPHDKSLFLELISEQKHTHTS